MTKATSKKPKTSPAKQGDRVRKRSAAFTDAEQAAMKERARELKSEARASRTRADGEGAVLAKIGGLPEPDRSLARRLHAIVTASGPGLWPKLWYGMPAYANTDGKVVCFFQAASKFKTRYSSLGFMDAGKLDEGAGGMWPTGFGLKGELLTAADEAKIASLVRKAVG